MAWQKHLDYAVIVALILVGLFTLVSGLVADRYGFPRFLYHTYAGYACGLLVFVHLTLNRKRVRAYLRRLLGDRRRTSAAQSVASQRAATQAATEEPSAASVEPEPPHPTSTRAVGRRVVLASSLSAAVGYGLGWLTHRQVQPRLPAETADLGLVYHQWTTPGFSGGSGGAIDWGSRPAGQKSYPGSDLVDLPDPRGWEGLSLQQAIETRRSHRTYGTGAMSLQDLSRLLHAAGGITDSARGFRSAPSAGALYPIELYALVHNVERLVAGIYHYAPQRHALQLVRAGDVRSELVVAGLGQEMLALAQTCLVLSAIFQRARWRYRERAYRYVLLEAGHIAQNIYLAATALGMGACAVGAFLDDRLNHMIGVDGDTEAALYILAVGTR